jgi:hypothetical protein
MWPAAAAMQLIGREIFLSTGKLDAANGIAFILGMSVLSGYARMWVNDKASGRPPRDPTNPGTLLAAMAQGGGLGIWGDYIFGETNRLGGGMASTALGPAGSDITGVLDLYQQWKADSTSRDPKVQNKALERLWPELAHGFVRHVPFANLIYLKGALDYMLWYHLYEAASPGWWARTNKRLIKEQGRPMAGYEPGGAIPWTPAAIGSKTVGGGEASGQEGGEGGSHTITSPHF